MLDSDVENVFRKLFDDVQKKDQFDQLRPLLAHYTAIQSVERIIENSELWFGSPLFMNDHEEVRFGLLEGERLLKSSPQIVKACGSPERAARFFSEFDGFSRHYVENHLGDTYVFCLSRHDPQDNDGRLSMWRGYGGNGNGAAIVFDTAQLNAIPTSALIVAKVEYGTHDERRAAIGTFITTFCEMLRVNEVTDDQLRIAAYWIYERIKLFALFSKHIGFAEEEEWRVVYMRERDREKKLDEMFGYLVGPRGIEPKLKFRVGPVEGLTSADLSLGKIVNKIILGPSLNSEIAGRTFRRMLEQHGHKELARRVVASTIPFRG